MDVYKNLISDKIHIYLPLLTPPLMLQIQQLMGNQFVDDGGLSGLSCQDLNYYYEASYVIVHMTRYSYAPSTHGYH